MKTCKNDSVPDSGDFPGRITLELTNQCNISCTFCPRKLMHGKQGFIDQKLAKKILDEVANHLPVSLVPFFRGEPLLHPCWDEILDYAKEKRIGPIQLTSNGTLMDQKAADRLLELELDFVSFSLDTVDKNLYERTRRGSNYDQVVANILYLLEMKEKRGLTLPEIQVSAVETEAHRPGMEDFIRFWRPRVDRVRIYVEHSQSGSPGAISQELPDSISRRLPCHKVFTDMVIYWNGLAALCNHDWLRESDRSLGDLNRQTISEIWSSAGYEALREKHLQGRLKDERPCDGCDHWQMYYLSGSLLGRVIQGQGGRNE